MVHDDIQAKPGAEGATHKTLAFQATPLAYVNRLNTLGSYRQYSDGALKAGPHRRQSEGLENVADHRYWVVKAHDDAPPLVVEVVCRAWLRRLNGRQQHWDRTMAVVLHGLQRSGWDWPLEAGPLLSHHPRWPFADAVTDKGGDWERLARALMQVGDPKAFLPQGEKKCAADPENAIFVHAQTEIREAGGLDDQLEAGGGPSEILGAEQLLPIAQTICALDQKRRLGAAAANPNGSKKRRWGL